MQVKFRLGGKRRAVWGTVRLETPKALTVVVPGRGFYSVSHDAVLERRP